MRAPERHQVESIYNRLINIAKGATLMTETKMEIDFLSGTCNAMYNSIVDEVLSECMRRVRPPRFNKEDFEFAEELRKSLPEGSMDGYYRLVPPDMLEMAKTILSQPINKIIVPPIGKGKPLPGSTDVADVSWKVPLGEFMTACQIMGSPGHSWQNVATSGMSIGHKGMLAAAKILALASIEFMNNPELVKKAKLEHEKIHKDLPYKSPFPEGLKPPLHRIKNQIPMN